MGRRPLRLADVRRRLLADPSLINVREAAIRILAKCNRCSLAEAEVALAELREHVEVDRVFKFVLPEVWARQKGSAIQRRVNFFKVVSDLFPVDWEYLDSCYMETGYDEDEDGRGVSFFDYGIIIDSMRPFETWQFTYHWDKLPSAYRLADVLFGDNDPAGRSNEWGPERKWELLVKEWGLDGPVKRVADTDRTAILCAFDCARGPLKFLSDAHKVLTFNTRSVFYDYDPEDGMESWEWTPESVAWLAKQAEVARRIEKGLKALSHWLDADPAGGARKALNYYTKHRRILEYEQKQRIRVGAEGAASPDARALVNVL